MVELYHPLVWQVNAAGLVIGVKIWKDTNFKATEGVISSAEVLTKSTLITVYTISALAHISEKYLQPAGEHAPPGFSGSVFLGFDQIRLREKMTVWRMHPLARLF